MSAPIEAHPLKDVAAFIAQLRAEAAPPEGGFEPGAFSGPMGTMDEFFGNRSYQ